MNTSNSAFWTPYKIPPTPASTGEDFYALSFSDDASPDKNPSQFLRWKIIPPSSGLPEGAVFREFNICENGNPINYWMPTWTEDPTPPPPEEE